jgi:tetratricopeptide (TPR) repeat protein
VHLESGNADRFDELLREEVLLAERLRIPAGLVLARTHQTTSHIARGEFAEAERRAAEAIEIGTRMQYALAENAFRGAMAMLGYHRGQLNEFLPLLAEGSERSRFLTYPAAQALFLAQAGRQLEARAMVDRLLADPGLEQWPRTNLWLMEVAFMGESISLVGPETLVGRCYEMLLPFARRQISATWAILTHGNMAYTLGRLARRLGRPDDAEAHYLAAIEQDRRFGFRPHVARSQAALANLLAERNRPGDRDQATTLLEASRAVANELGMRLVLTECDQVDAKLSVNGTDLSKS